MIESEHAMLPIGGKLLEVTRYRGHERAQTIVLLHEALGSVSHWRDFPQKLATATHCDVIVYSRPGHGESEGPVEARGLHYLERQASLVLRSILDRFSVHRPILFGHSEGGLIALLYAALYPRSPRAIIVESAIVLMESSTLDGMHQARAAYRESGLKEKLQRYHRDPDAVFYAFSGPWTAGGDPETLKPYLSRIECPTLILQGDRDEYGSPKQSEELLQHVPHARRVMIPSCGHTPHREQPATVLAEVRTFLQPGSVLK